MQKVKSPGMDKTDRELLNLVQGGFPLVDRPYHALAEKLGISEREARERIARFREKGTIRRIGGVLDAARLGYPGLLVAVQARGSALGRLAGLVRKHPGVTHGYVRSGRPNFWFTLQARDRKALNRAVREIEEGSGLRLICLPARRRFKIDFRVDF